MSGHSFEHREFVPPRDRPRRPRTLGATLDAAAKRALDITLSAALLLVAAPVLLGCAIAVKVESRGPVFYRARRIGREGRELRVLKFRKMFEGAGGHALTSSRDERFTRLGRFLAASKLDELPQLWNVLRGEMSLVGPRPEDPRFAELHADAYARILTVRPGVTGLCQLAFAKECDILDPEDRVGDYVDRILPQKVNLDLLYAESRSFRKDLAILFWTVVPVVLRADVAVNRDTGRLTLRRRARQSVSAPT